PSSSDECVRRQIGGILVRMRVTIPFAVLITAAVAASDTYPTPRFADPGRVAKLQSAMSEIDRIFRAYATDKKIPGMIWGVVIDGQVAHLARVVRRPRPRLAGACAYQKRDPAGNH